MQHSCSHSNAIHNQKFKKRITTQTDTTTRCKTHRRNQFAHETTPAAPAAHTRYLSSPAAATLHGKTQGFVLRLPSHNTRHATFMQPFQCDLPPQLQETQRTTHTGTTIFAKHIEGTKRPQPQPPHKRGTFHRRLQPLYTEKHKDSCSSFLPNTKPMQHHHFPSSPLPFFTTSLRHHFPSSPLPFLTTSLRHHSPSSSLPNAIHNQRFKKRIELRRQTQPLVAKHIGGTNSRMKRPQPHPPHTRGTFHRRLQPLYTEKHKVSCSGFLPTR